VASVPSLKLLIALLQLTSAVRLGSWHALGDARVNSGKQEG
jgi:hypothetical protein